jgi:hypothetical protein
MKAQPLNFLARASAAFAMLCVITGAAVAAPLGHAAATPRSNTPAARFDRDFGKVPLSFEPNQGQTDAKVQFLSRGQGYALFLTPGEAVLELQKSGGKKLDAARSLPAPSVLRMTLVGADAKAAVSGEQPLPGTSNYFIGNDSSKWKTAVPTYQRVAYSAVYPGVDLVYYGNQRQLEYDFVVAPGADAAKIAIQFSGANPAIDKAGDLVLAVQGEEARFHKPVVYQFDGDRKISVAGRYQIAHGKVGFSLGTYDHSKALVIDPVLSYLTYIGGSSSDLISNLAVDDAGSVYIVGTTSSTDYPVKNGYQSTDPNTIASGNPLAIFVSKFNATGTALVYSTYLGSTEYTYGNGIAVDGSGNAYVVGYTTYGTYPVTSGAYQTICGAEYMLNGPTATRINGCTGAGQGDEGGVLTKLNPDGTALVYSTYYSGDNGNVINAVAVDASGQAYVTGLTTSFNYPAANGDQCLPTTAGAVQTCEANSTGGGRRSFGFLAKFDAAGANLLYGTLLGPTTAAQSITEGYAVAADAAGFAYIGGSTYNNLYTTADAYQAGATNGNGAHAFAAKFDTVGKKIVYSTYLTGSDNTSNVGEAVTSIAADASGNTYVAGYTSECSFPTTAGAFEPQAEAGASCNAGVIAKLDPTGSSLVWSTFLGHAPAGNGVNSGGNASINGMTLGPDGSVYVTGQTNGGGFPTVNPLFSVSGNFGFISRVSADGTRLLFSTPFGSSTGNSTDIPYGVAVDASGNIYFAGQTNGNLLPVTAGAFQSAHAGGNNGNYYTTGFVGKIAPTVTTTTTLTLPTGTVTAGQSVKFSAKVAAQAGSTGTPTGTVTFLSDSTTLGTGTLDTTATATYTATSLNATTYNVTASYAGDTAFSASVSGAQSLVVAPASATVTLTAPATASAGSSVTLSVTVTGTPGTPTGTVTFKDGATTLGTATLASGAASYTTSALATGAHSITVSYSGDSVFGAATSAASTVTIGVPPAISFAAQPTSLTVVHGSSGSVVITGTPVGGYTGTVTFACGTLPTAASCNFAPASLTFTGNNTVAVTTLTFGTSTAVAALESLSTRATMSPVFAALLLLPLGFKLRRKLMCSGALLSLLVLASAAGLGGCGSSRKSPTPVTTPAGTYTVPVTITAGTAVSTLNVSVIVQ